MTYKLTYFDITGLGEPIRFLFKYGNIDFIDNRIKREDWPKLKETMPFGQMPVLEVEGKQFSQSISICRFLSKKVGLAGSNDLENLEIDSIVDTINDFRIKLIAVHHEPDEAKKEEKKKNLKEEIIPFYLGRLDKIAGGNKNHLALNRLTWADIYFTAFIDSVNAILKFDLVDGFSNLQSLMESVKNIPNIKKWMETRPASTF